jgi:hypothetical protein
MGESSPATGPPQRHLCFGEQRDHHLLHFVDETIIQVLIRMIGRNTTLALL